MRRYVLCCLGMLALSLPVRAGELDNESGPARAAKVTKASAAPTGPVLASRAAVGSELDKEAPQQSWRGCHRGWGYGCGYGRGFGYGYGVGYGLGYGLGYGSGYGGYGYGGYGYGGYGYGGYGYGGYPAYACYRPYYCSYYGW